MCFLDFGCTFSATKTLIQLMSVQRRTKPGARDGETAFPATSFLRLPPNSRSKTNKNYDIDCGLALVQIVAIS